MDKPDKRLYSYKEALSQPYWLQEVNGKKFWSHPVKLSNIVYSCIFTGIFWFVSSILIPFTEFGFRLMLSVGSGVYFGSIFADLEIDGKWIIFYLKDYLLYYLLYYQYSDKYYLNKGKMYRKPKTIIDELRKER